jgi:hypothetical protein
MLPEDIILFFSDRYIPIFLTQICQGHQKMQTQKLSWSRRDQEDGLTKYNGKGPAPP